MHQSGSFHKWSTGTHYSGQSRSLPSFYRLLLILKSQRDGGDVVVSGTLPHTHVTGSNPGLIFAWSNQDFHSSVVGYLLPDPSERSKALTCSPEGHRKAFYSRHTHSICYYISERESSVSASFSTYTAPMMCVDNDNLAWLANKRSTTRQSMLRSDTKSTQQRKRLRVKSVIIYCYFLLFSNDRPPPPPHI
uniref:Uncharacterized protein n=1 Tax=Haemonchus placei TaxID=6290 RepID=A0A0N4WNR1_HAEPC